MMPEIPVHGVKIHKPIEEGVQTELYSGLIVRKKIKDMIFYTVLD